METKRNLNTSMMTTDQLKTNGTKQQGPDRWILTGLLPHFAAVELTDSRPTHMKRSRNFATSRGHLPEPQIDGLN